ncbi:uncharacterized protein GGS25DRAFT_426051 [Hypoxylon fragiforme]|uniref:uncharacterized protein n=1 Tax=Hypoxylon fragiforme TaxID=63214 RepID=UPI0020C603FF|nr:uncharacterized protein GGS25DRAFT_426051 [Hypoxylon fragiforme]KAI2605328.1 hypothetical protein GGS25DRAFT_426051 [Hypoxylon fragiforme]
MSRFVDDVKTGLKGIRGAGDAIRGQALEATDQVFDNNPRHPQTQASQIKNRTIADKGKQDIAHMDNMIARREVEHENKNAIRGKGVNSAHHPTTTTTTTTTTTRESNAPAHPTTANGTYY